MIKVSELIEKLKTCNPDAFVHIMVSQNMPIEHKCVAVKERKEFSDWFDESKQRNADDVFLMQGSTIRPGNKKAW